MRVGTLVLVVTLVSTLSAEAQQPVGSMETLLSRVKSGDIVYVTDSSAREATGTFVKMADATLTLLVDGELREMPTLDVRQVARPGDSVKNGFLIGAAIGGGLGMVGGDSCYSEFGCGDPSSADRMLGGVFGALMFGGMGALIDYIIKGRTVVYRAGPRAAVRLAPVLLPHQRGIQISTNW